MANYDELKAAIRAAIYENTEQAITGDALQDILLEMVDDLNDGKADAFEAVHPLVLANGELTLDIGLGLTYGGGGELEVDFSSVQKPITPQAPLAWDIYDLILQLGDGLTVTNAGDLTINLGDGLLLDSDTGELGVDFGDVEATANKTDDIAGNASSSTKYASTKGVYDYVQEAIFGAMSNSY